MVSLRGNKGNTVRRIRNIDTLTPSETRIWELHKAGNTRKEIAEKLSIAEDTVYRRMLTIQEKITSMRRDGREQ